MMSFLFLVLGFAQEPSRGGYETTFGIRSKLAPEAGDLLADCAIRLLRSK
jgi:hypothetical protein